MSDYLDWVPVSERTWKVVEGHVDVDAGLMMIGDPCYTLPEPGDDPGYAHSPRHELGRDWGDFCSRLQEEEEEVLREKGIDPRPHYMVDDPTAKYGMRAVTPEEEMEQRRASEEHRPKVYHPWKKQPGAAIVTQTGYGDGTYPVTVEYVEFEYRNGRKEKRVKSVTVTFIGDDEDEEYDD